MKAGVLGAVARKRGRIAVAACALTLTAFALLLAAREATGVDPPICGQTGTATKFWDGQGATDSWHDPLNWSQDTLPGGGDVVCIDAAGPIAHSVGTTTIQALEATGELQITGGAIDATNNLQDSSIAALTLAGGALGTDADLVVVSFEWTGGNHFVGDPFQAPSTTTVTGSLSVPLSALSFRDLTNRTLVIPNGVTGTFSGGIGMRFSNATLEIQPGGVFDVAANGGFLVGGGSSGLIVNDGTFRRSAGNDTFAIAPTLQNNANFEVNSGEVELRSSSTDANGGNFSLADGTTLILKTGAHALGTTTISDGVASATAEVQSGSVTLAANNALDVANVSISGGSLSLGGANTVPNLTQTGGALTGAGNLSAGALTWSDGTQSAGANTTRTTVTSALTLSGAAVKTLATRTLRIATGAVATHAEGGLNLNSSARLETQAGGLFDLAGAGVAIGGDGTGTIDNDGTLRKTGGGASSVDPALQNDGALDAQAGSLVASTGLTNAGTIEVGAGALLNSTGAFTNFSGTTLTGGTYLIEGTLQFAGADVRTNAAQVLLGLNGQIVDGSNADALRNLATNDGALTLVGGATVDPVSSLHNNGTLGGVGTLASSVTNAGIVSPGLSPGTLAIGGSYTQAPDGTLEVEIGGTGAGQFDVLAVSGAATLGGTLDIDSSITPAPGASFEIITHASRSGIFSTILGSDLADPNAYVPVYGVPGTLLEVRPPSVDAPQITSTDPSSPSSSTSPKVIGTVGGGDPVTIRIHLDDPACAAPADASGTVDQFTGGGIPVPVPPNATSTIRASAVDAAGNGSGCSNAITYVEDSGGPAAPEITSTDPASPSSTSTTPKLKGTAPSDAATIVLFTQAGCAGPSVSGTSSAFSGAGIEAAVSPNATTQLSAQALDAVGNASPCSAAFAYTHDSVAPETQIDSSPPALSAGNDPAFTYSSPEAGVTFECGLDGAFEPCTAAGRGFTDVADGTHTFAVRARDAAGNADPTPPSATFTVDTARPNTVFTEKPATRIKTRKTKVRVKFRFKGIDEAGGKTGFECALDRRRFKRCGSGVRFDIRAVRRGRSHVFRVRAVDAAGNRDRSPAVHRFTVLRR